MQMNFNGLQDMFDVRPTMRENSARDHIFVKQASSGVQYSTGKY